MITNMNLSFIYSVLSLMSCIILAICDIPYIYILIIIEYPIIKYSIINFINDINHYRITNIIPVANAIPIAKVIWTEHWIEMANHDIGAQVYYPFIQTHNAQMKFYSDIYYDRLLLYNKYKLPALNPNISIVQGTSIQSH